MKSLLYSAISTTLFTMLSWNGIGMYNNKLIVITYTMFLLLRETP